MKNFLNNTKAITLISLVITIIVLLILSGITLKFIISDDGVISKSADAITQYEIDRDKEKIMMAVKDLMVKSDQNEVEIENLQKCLDNQFGAKATSVYYDDTKLVVKVIDNDSRYYQVDDYGKVDFRGLDSEIYKNFQNLEVLGNIFNLDQVTKNSYINKSNGELSSYNGWDASDYMDISQYDKYIIVSENSSFLSSYNAVYDENKNFIRAIQIKKELLDNEMLGTVNASIAVLEFENNEKYLKISESKSILEKIKIFPVKNTDFNGVLDLKIDDNIFSKYKFMSGKFDGNVVKGTYIGLSKGEEIAYNTWDSTGYIDVSNYTDIALTCSNLSSLGAYNAMYDKDKNFLQSFSVSNIKAENSFQIGNYKMLELPEGVSYIRLSAVSGTFDDFQVYPRVLKENDSSKKVTSNLEISNNLFTPDLRIDNTYIKTTGEIINYNGWSSTDYIDISSNSGFLVKNQKDEYNAFYDESKKFVSKISFQDNFLNNSVLGKVGIELAYFNGINGVKYVRLSNDTESLKQTGVYSILNDDFNEHIKFKIKE